MGLDFLGLQRLVPTISEEAAPAPPSENMLFWFLSDTDVFQQSDGTIPAGNGDVVGYWGDQSVNGYNATQATSSKKATLQTNIINSLPALRFDTTDDIIENTTGSIPEVQTLFVVCANANAGFTDQNYIFTQVSANFSFFESPFGGGRVQASSGTLDARDSSPFGTAFKICTVIQDGSNSIKFYYNGVLAASDLLGTPSAHTGRISVGGFPTLGNSWDGDISEVIGYSSVLSNDDINLVGSYMANRYGLSWTDL